MTRKEKAMILVVPQIHIMPDQPWPFGSIGSVDRRQAPLQAAMGSTLSVQDDPGEILFSEVADFIDRALTDPRFRFLLEIATAHVVAVKALDDPYFRCDRYQTRVDEWLSPIWELAQDIYEANAAHQEQVWPPTRERSRRAVGLAMPGDTWWRPLKSIASGLIRKPVGRAK